MATAVLASPVALDPSRFKLHTASNPFSWLYVEYEPGKRLTSKMVSFDLTRADIHVNCYGVVHFYDAFTAKRLLKMAH